MIEDEIISEEVYMPTSRDLTISQTMSKVTFRDYITMESITSRIWRGHWYMNELDCIPMFTAKYGLDYSGWVELADSNHDSTHYKVYPRDIQPVSSDESVYPTILVFDIECMSGSGSGMPKSFKQSDRIEMISLIFTRYKSETQQEYLLVIVEPGEEPLPGVKAEQVPCSSELDLIQKFFKLVNELDPDIVTGYNIYGFDFRYIMDRLRFYLTPLPNLSKNKHGQTRIKFIDWESSAYGFNTYEKVEMEGRIVIDLMLYFRRFKLEKYSLDYVSEEFLGTGKDDVPYGYMWKAFESRDLEMIGKVANYCVKDSMLVLRLFNKFNLWTDLCEMSKAMRCRIEDIYTRGEQHKVLNQIIKECLDRDIVLKQSPSQKMGWSGYDGAHVLPPKKGVYDMCAIVDFQSLYPSILIAHNICPSTYIRPGCISRKGSHDISVGEDRVHRYHKSPSGILPGLVQKLMNDRTMVKKTLSQTTDELTRLILDRRQNALKICANSIYGIMGFEKNKYFGHLPSAESITAQGRLYLQKVVGYISDHYPVEIIYGDTDSCMIIPEVSQKSYDEYVMLVKEIADDVTNWLPSPMRLNYEDCYEKIILMSKKRYIMYKNGKPKYKGVMYARRGYCKFAKDLYQFMILEICTGKSTESILASLDEKLMELLKGQVSVDHLTMTKSVKNLDDYKVDPPQVIMAKRLISQGVEVVPGTRLEYVFTTNGRLQGERMYKPDELERQNVEVDYLYYIKHQLVSQLDDLLELLGKTGYLRDTVKILSKVMT